MFNLKSIIMKKYLYLLLLAFVPIFFVSCEDKKSTSYESSVYETTTSSKSSLNYEDTFYIDDDICGAYTSDDLSEMIKYITRNDKRSFDQMRRLGYLIDLESGTEIKLIDIGVTKSQVKLNDGRKVWVANEFITSTKKVSPNAKYHDSSTGERTSKYAGSAEQQRDLELIDEYLKNHPED